MPLPTRLRGVRTPIPQGYILGRKSAGTGDTELLTLNDVRALGVASQQDVVQQVNGAVSGLGAAVTVQMTAGVDLSGQRVVIANGSGLAVYPDISVLADALAVIGITEGAISNGAVGNIIAIGQLTEPSWSWTPGAPVYCADIGVLTQTLPTGKWILQIATAITSTSIAIEPRTVLSLP